MCSIQANIGHLTSTMQRCPVYGGFAIGQNFISFNRELQEEKVVVIDDSFEQEVWYKGNKRGLLLIVEFWHPDLSETKRTAL